MIFITILILTLVVFTLCWPAYEHSEKVMLGKLILCSALLYGLGLCWAAEMVLS